MVPCRSSAVSEDRHLPPLAPDHGAVHLVVVVLNDPAVCTHQGEQPVDGGHTDRQEFRMSSDGGDTVGPDQGDLLAGRDGVCAARADRGVPQLVRACADVAAMERDADPAAKESDREHTVIVAVPFARSDDVDDFEGLVESKHRREDLVPLQYGVAAADAEGAVASRRRVVRNQPQRKTHRVSTANFLSIATEEHEVSCVGRVCPLRRLVKMG